MNNIVAWFRKVVLMDKSVLCMDRKPRKPDNTNKINARNKASVSSIEAIE
jgi:hypothetical protein